MITSFADLLKTISGLHENGELTLNVDQINTSNSDSNGQPDPKLTPDEKTKLATALLGSSIKHLTLQSLRERPKKLPGGAQTRGISESSIARRQEIFGEILRVLPRLNSVRTLAIDIATLKDDEGDLEVNETLDILRALENCTKLQSVDLKLPQLQQLKNSSESIRVFDPLSPPRLLIDEWFKKQRVDEKHDDDDDVDHDDDSDDDDEKVRRKQPVYRLRRNNTASDSENDDIDVHGTSPKSTSKSGFIKDLYVDLMTLVFNDPESLKDTAFKSPKEAFSELQGFLTHDVTMAFEPSIFSNASLHRLLLQGRLSRDASNALRKLSDTTPTFRELDLSLCYATEKALAPLLKPTKQFFTLHLPDDYPVTDANKETLLQLLKDSPLLELRVNHDPDGSIDAANRSNRFNRLMHEIDDALLYARAESSRYLDRIAELLLQAKECLITVALKDSGFRSVRAAGNSDLFATLELREKASQWLWRVMQLRLLIPDSNQELMSRLQFSQIILSHLDRSSSAFVPACVAIQSVLETAPIAATKRKSLQFLHIVNAMNALENDASNPFASQVRAAHQALINSIPADERSEDALNALDGEIHKDPQRQSNQLVDCVPLGSLLLASKPYNCFRRSLVQLKISCNKTDSFLLHSLLSELNGVRTVSAALLQENLYKFPGLKTLLQKESQELLGVECTSDSCAEFFNALRDLRRSNEPFSKINHQHQQELIAHAFAQREELEKSYAELSNSFDARQQAIDIFKNMLEPRGWSSVMNYYYGRRDMDLAKVIKQRLEDKTSNVADVLLEGIWIHLQRYKNAADDTTHLRDNSCARRLLYCLTLVTPNPEEQKRPANAETDQTQPKSGELSSLVS